MTTPTDANGHPDVMGSRILTDEQLARIDSVKLKINELLATDFARTNNMTGEQARLTAMARSSLETAGVLMVKAISREGE